MTRKRFEYLLAALFIAILVAGCASSPPPRAALDTAELNIEQAREQGAEDYAPVELGRAIQRMAAADGAMAARDYAAADRYAQLAMLEAQLADYRSRAAKGREKVRRQTDENARLRKELLGEGAR